MLVKPRDEDCGCGKDEALTEDQGSTFCMSFLPDTEKTLDINDYELGNDRSYFEDFDDCDRLFDSSMNASILPRRRRANTTNVDFLDEQYSIFESHQMKPSPFNDENDSDMIIDTGISPTRKVYEDPDFKAPQPYEDTEMSEFSPPTFQK
jgi:hypothetical protein